MTWIQTARRRCVDLADPKPETIVLPDIAHALSRICRYGRKGDERVHGAVDAPPPSRRLGVP